MLNSWKQLLKEEELDQLLEGVHIANSPHSKVGEKILIHHI